MEHIFAEGAFSVSPHEVPLVIYDPDGNRRVIGQATIEPNGQIAMKVTDEMIVDMLETTGGNFSIADIRLTPQPYEEEQK